MGSYEELASPDLGIRGGSDGAPRGAPEMEGINGAEHPLPTSKIGPQKAPIAMNRLEAGRTGFENLGHHEPKKSEEKIKKL